MVFTVFYLVVSCLICSGILYIMMWLWRRRSFYKFASKFEGPISLPIIGNGYLFIGSTEYIFNKMDELYRLYPSPFRLWFAKLLVICVNDPDYIKMVCLSPKTLEKSQLLKNLSRSFLGTGILMAPVPKWKVNRKLIQPTFNYKILDSFVEIFSNQSKILTDKIERYLDGEEFELFKFLFPCTLDMICETAMGVNIEAQKNENLSYMKASQVVVEILGKRLFSFWLYPDFIFNRTQLGKEQKKQLELMHDFTDNVIKMRRNELLKRSNQSDEAKHEDNECKPIVRREAFLDHLIKLSYNSNNFSDEELRTEVDTMIFAGTDTSVTADSFVMLMLASHPEIQEKVYQELYEIYGVNDVEEHPVTSKDLPRMKYLDRVIKETLRLFPPAAMITRMATDDLQIGDHTFPNDSIILIGIMSLHRNEKYWPDPFKFNPDRFLPEEISKRHPYAYMPFSGGPRNCIGINYAMMAVKTLIATVLRRYILIKDVILPVNDIRLKIETIMKPVHPITLRIEKRIR